MLFIDYPFILNIKATAFALVNEPQYKTSAASKS